MDLKSPQINARLSTGALVRELKLDGERLHYDLLEGGGPATGWGSISLKDKPLLTKTDRQAQEAAKASVQGPGKPIFTYFLRFLGHF